MAAAIESNLGTAALRRQPPLRAEVREATAPESQASAGEPSVQPSELTRSPGPAAFVNRKSLNGRVCSCPVLVGTGATSGNAHILKER
jgi:hypothetical protein